MTHELTTPAAPGFWQHLTAVHPSIMDVGQQRQSKLLARLVLVIFGLAIFTALREYHLIQTTGGEEIVFWAGITALFVFTPVYFLNRFGHYMLSARLFVLFYILLVGAYGIVNNEGIFFVTVGILLAAMLLSLRETVLVAAFLLVSDIVLANVNPIRTELVRDTTTMFTVYASAVIVTYVTHRQQVEDARQTELRVANDKLRTSEASLERRVVERTRDLQISADVSRQITTILDVQELLTTVTETTKAKFGLYHSSVYLFDSASKQLRLEAGAGDAGDTMKAGAWSFNAATDRGLVPESARTQRTILINDVSADKRYAANTYLPLTRSELALPMTVGDTLLGILDFQSEQADHFTTDDVRIMTTLAEQIAIAVNNARLYAAQVRVADRLREVDTMKSSFLASMSHELRTPLNAILNFTKFVSNGMLGPVNEKQVDALNKTIESGKHLLNLINDVLDITKIESQMLTLFVETDVNLSNELDMVAATGETLLADRPEVIFERDFDPALPLIIGDRRRIRQILLNLVSNACKFTEAGRVTLSAQLDDGNVRLSVQDTGPGIAPEDHEVIFESFRQTHIGLSHGGGTGLGLAIARRLAEAHGGRLWLESQPGCGATFTVLLPVRNAALVASAEKQGA